MSIRLWLGMSLLAMMVVVVAPVFAQTEPESSAYVAWSPNGNLIAIGFHNGSISIYDSVNEMTIRTLAGHTDEIIALAWSSDGTKIASGGWDQQINIWDVSSGQLLQNIPLNNPVFHLNWYPEGERILVFNGNIDGPIQIWNVNSGLLIEEFIGLALDSEWSPEGNDLAIAAVLGVIVFQSDSPLSVLNNAPPPLPEAYEQGFDLSRLAWSNDGNWIATGSLDGTVHIWDVTTGNIILTLQGNETGLSGTSGQIRAITFSADDSIIQSFSGDGTIRGWNSITGDLLDTVTFNGEIFGAEWSPDGSQLAYGTANGVQIVPVPSFDDDVEDED